MSLRAPRLDEIIDLPGWQALQGRIAEVSALRLGLWDEDAQRVLPPPMPPPACQYVLSEPGRRERCEQFHGSVRAEVRRRRRTICATCPFGVQYLALPIQGSGLFAGHWEGGYVVEPGTPIPADPTLDPHTWQSALAVTPHRTLREIESALGLVEQLQRPVLDALALRERRRDQVAQVVGYELRRSLEATRDPWQALEHFVHLAGQVLGVPLAALLLRQPGGDLEVVALEGPLTRHLRTLEAGGPAGRVLTSAAPLLVTDLRAQPELVVETPGYEKVRSALAVPVRLGGQVAGALELASYAPFTFVPDDVGLLERLAELVEGVLRPEMQERLATKD